MRIEVRQDKNPDDALEKALKILKKKTAGMFKELRNKKYFIKPSAIKHQKKLDIQHKMKVRNRKKGKQWKR